MGRPSRKGELLTAGIDVLHKRGYAGSSVDTIVEQAGMQKGSFFGHFGSKEAFAVEALKGYFSGWSAKALLVMDDPELTAKQKLDALIGISTVTSRSQTFQYGCLIGNLSAELAVDHEPLRDEIKAIFQEWQRPFAQLIREGVALGEFRAGLDPEIGARFIINALQGTVLRGKIERSAAPLDDYMAVLSVLLLPA